MTRPIVESITANGARSTIYRDAPSWQGARTAAVGAFACETADAGATLLLQVVQALAREGFDRVIGPMDGDTWHNYRVVSESDGSPPFLLEPRSGQHDRDAFARAGFAPISTYVSARAPIADAVAAHAPRIDGVAITAWDGSNADQLIARLFDLSRSAFANNAFYKPITRDDFLALYAPIIPAIDPRLVFFAHAGGDLAGYLFALPNRLEGARPSTAIIKTYASGVRGVGRMLVDHAHRTIAEQGYTHVIHALMHVDNASLDRSRRHAGSVFRRYELMGRFTAGAQGL